MILFKTSYKQIYNLFFELYGFFIVFGFGWQLILLVQMNLLIFHKFLNFM